MADFQNMNFPDTNGTSAPKAKTKKWFSFPLKVAAIAAAVGLVAAAVFGHLNTTSAQTTGTGSGGSDTGILQTVASGDEDSSSSGSDKVAAVDVSSVVEDAMPSIVAINCYYEETGTYSMLTGESDEATEGAGSGIIVAQTDDTLYIATNNHVVDGADSIKVTFSNEASADATIKGTDADDDLAVVSVKTSDLSSDTLSSIKVATLGDSDSLKVGESAIAIGNALGYGQSVTTGVISATGRKVETEDGTTGTYIQTDAAINPGNSGGALLNSKGEVIGINSAKLSDTSVEGMGYAIPINTAIPIINQLIQSETVSEADRGYLGISGISVTSSIAESYDIPQGVYVSEVAEGSAAESAGMQQGDIIVEFDGHTVSSMDGLQSLMQYYASGTTVDVVVERKSGDSYTKKTLSVTLQSSSDSSSEGSSSSSSEGSQGSSSSQMPSDGSSQYGGSQQGAGVPGSTSQGGSYSQEIPGSSGGSGSMQVMP